MKFFSLISHESIHNTDNDKIVSSKDFSTLIKSSDLLKKVKNQAKEYKLEIAKECELEKEQAYRDGYLAGLEKFNEMILEIDEKIQTLEKSLKKQILPIALKAAKKILGDEIKLDPSRVVDIVVQTLKNVTQSHRVKVYVNKNDLEELEKNKAKLKSILEQVEYFSIQERLDVEPGGCIIETEAGIINAQLENQWRAIESAFEKFTNRQ
jgi:type III secretion protein L